MKAKYAFILALMITLLIAFNSYFFKTIDMGKRETVFVTRVIDGDTLEIEGDKTIRLLNINTPEKNEKGYGGAKEFLKELENTTVEIEELGTDKYDRTLARVFTETYVNLDLVKRGLARKFLVDESELDVFADAEREAIEQEKGSWKKSPYFDCLSSEIDEKEELVYLENKCENITLNGWVITDESRKKYILTKRYFSQMSVHSSEGEDNETDLFWSQNQNVWNNDRDTLYVYDSEGNIAHYNSYGY